MGWFLIGPVMTLLGIALAYADGNLHGFYAICWAVWVLLYAHRVITDEYA